MTEAIEQRYPTAISVEPQIADRNRLTTFFRAILAIPHIILVGPSSGWGSNGLVGAAAYVMAFFAWFVILFTGRHPRGMWDFALYYMRWRTRAVAYLALLRDEYPPFGDGEYPASFEAAFPGEPRDRVSVGFRIFLVIPHAIVLAFLILAWIITSIVAWFAILFTGRYPQGLYNFGLGVMRWGARVEGYLLLMHDRYPPFSLD